MSVQYDVRLTSKCAKHFVRATLRSPQPDYSPSASVATHRPAEAGLPASSPGVRTQKYLLLSQSSKIV